MFQKKMIEVVVVDPPVGGRHYRSIKNMQPVTKKIVCKYMGNNKNAKAFLT